MEEIKTKRMNLISKKNLNKLIQADPFQRDYTTLNYYKPLIKNLYLKRIKMGLELLGQKKFKQILDIGFGAGIIIPELSLHGSHLEGVDIHKNINLVKQIIKDENINNINLQYGDAIHLPFADNSFDCIWCMSVLEFILDSEKVIQEIKRVAKNEAKIIIGFPITNPLTNLSYKLIGFKSNETHKNNHRILIQQIKKYLKIKEIKHFPCWLQLDYSLFCVLLCYL